MDPVPFEFDYRVRQPGPRLDRFVAGLWYARGTVPYRRERIAPTGSSVALLIFGDPIAQVPDNGAGVRVESDEGLLIGPHTGPILNEPLGETHAVGVVTTPVGCEAVFGVAPADIRAAVRPVSESWPAGAVVREALRGIEDPDACLERMESLLIEHLDAGVPGVERCAEAVALLDADPMRPIAEVADAIGVSHGHLDREFTRVVGLTPRRLATLLRMNRLLGALDVQGATNWAARATELGWFDQAHLIRDFKRHTGVTPTQYVAAQRSVFGPVADEGAAGFVPEF